MSLNAYLILSAVLFCIGLVGVIRRKNLLMLFFATEIMLNAVNIGLAAVSHFHQDLTGQMFAFFIVAIAAAYPIFSVQYALEIKLSDAAFIIFFLPIIAPRG